MGIFNQLLGLFSTNLFPMFALIGIGFGVQKALSLDLNTLNRANIFIFVPGLLFDRILRASIPLNEALLVALIGGISIVAMLLLGRAVMQPFKSQRTYVPVAALSGAFANTGNFGIPLMGLFFGAEGVFIQSILLMVNNLMVYSVGVFSLTGGGSIKRAIRSFLRIPVPYVFALAVALRALQIDLPRPVMTTVGYLGDGLIPVALITLGAQLAGTRLKAHMAPIGCAVALRLMVAPLLTAALVFLISTTGLLAWDSLVSKVLIVNAAIPAAVNTVIVSMEFKSHPEVAAGAILIGTICSAVTLTFVLWMV